MSKELPEISEQDENLNNILAAGAVLGALWTVMNLTALESVFPISDQDGKITNVIEVRMGMLKSPYRLTVERVRDENEQQ